MSPSEKLDTLLNPIVMVELNSQEHYVALAGSLDREAEARLEQEPGVESKAKKLTRSDSVNHDEDDDYDDYNH